MPARFGLRASRCALPAIPDRPDGRPCPARAKAAAVVMTAEKSGAAEIVMPATVRVVARHIIRGVADRSFGAVNRHAVVRRLMIAGEEAVAMPMVMPLVRRRGKRDGGQQR